MKERRDERRGRGGRECNGNERREVEGEKGEWREGSDRRIK